VYIADRDNQRIRKVTVSSTGIITTIAGSSTSGTYSGDNGQATSAGLNYPVRLTVDSSGRTHVISLNGCLNEFILGNIYFADYNNHRIRKVTVSTGIITTIAGTGASSFSGDEGAATSATLYYPSGVKVDSSGKAAVVHNFIIYSVLMHSLLLGNVYIADTSNNRIRKVTMSTATSSPRYSLTHSLTH
jgi:hypothetical protein